MAFPSFLAVVDESDPYYGLYEFGWAMETFVLVGSLLGLFIGLFRFFPLGLHRLYARVPNPGLGAVRAAQLFALLWFFFVLNFGAATDILGPFYNALYVSLSLACLFLASYSWPILDLYFPADVLERWNLGAGLVYAGFTLGTAFAFGGALTGEGPGWWVVIVFFLLAYFELRANLALVSTLSGRLKDDVRLDRDATAGLLLGAVAVASGLVSGRAAAGDFLGWEHGLADYGRRLWPLLVIAFAGALAGGFSKRLPSASTTIRVGASAALVAFGLGVYFFT